MIVLIFSSCQKIVEFYSVSSSTTETVPACRIKSYSSVNYESINQTFIDYNEKGDPTWIFYYADWLPDGQAFERFKYDSLGRLIAHIPDNFLGNRRIYVYEGESRIPLRDTATDFQGKKYLESFKTDAKGRIIEEEIKWIYSPPDLEDDFPFQTEVYHYYYDLQGNRQVNPFDYPWHKTLKYSKKPSLYSLNYVWQLIHRDFSKNGLTNVGAYNERGLPISFIVNDFAYWQPFLDMTQHSTITYDCIDDVK